MWFYDILCICKTVKHWNMWTQIVQLGVRTTVLNSYSWPVPLEAPNCRTFCFTTEVEVQEVINIRKVSNFSLRSPGVSSCSHTAICPEPTVPQAAIHPGTSRLLWKLCCLGGGQTPSFDESQQHRLLHFHLQTGPLGKSRPQLGFGPPQQVPTTQLDWYTKCDDFSFRLSKR